MICQISKEHTREHIVYTRSNDECVKKSHYQNGKLTKEKVINVREVHQKGRSHRNVEDFFEDMIWNYGYRADIVKTHDSV